MRQETKPASQAIALTADGASEDSVEVKHYLEKTLAITGDFVGFCKVQGTLDGGTTWLDVAGPVAAPAIVSVPVAVDSLRLFGVGWVSGSASAIFSGFNSRTD